MAATCVRLACARAVAAAVPVVALEERFAAVSRLVPVGGAAWSPAVQRVGDDSARQLERVDVLPSWAEARGGFPHGVQGEPLAVARHRGFPQGSVESARVLPALASRPLSARLAGGMCALAAACLAVLPLACSVTGSSAQAGSGRLPSGGEGRNSVTPLVVGHR